MNERYTDINSKVIDSWARSGWEWAQPIDHETYLRALASERMVAEREGYSIRMVRADMTQRLPFEDGEFDLIFHPVSNCYIEDVYPVWRECARVLKTGGILLAGLDNGINFLFDEDENKLCHSLPFNPLKDEALYRESMENDWGIQFSHSIEEQIGGQLKAGFMLTDVYDDTNGSGRLHELGAPAFWATRAVNMKKSDAPLNCGRSDKR